jgi:hypothetical protein
MSCKNCHAENQLDFAAEVGIHFPDLNGLENPLVFVFPNLLICFNCGFAEFVVPKTELRRLGEGADGPEPRNLTFGK